MENSSSPTPSQATGAPMQNQSLGSPTLNTMQTQESPKKSPTPNWKIILAFIATLIISLLAGFLIGRLANTSNNNSTSEVSNATMGNADGESSTPINDNTDSKDSTSISNGTSNEASYVVSEEDKRQIKEKIQLLAGPKYATHQYAGMSESGFMPTLSLLLLSDDLTNEQKIAKTLNSIIGSCETVSNESLDAAVCKKDDVEKQFFYIFGEQLPMSEEGINDGCGTWYTDSTTGDFRKTLYGCGGFSPTVDMVKIVGYKVNGEQVYVDVIGGTIYAGDTRNVSDIYLGIFQNLDDAGTPMYQAISDDDVIKTIDASLSQFARYTIIFNIVEDETGNTIMAFDKVIAQ